MCFLIYLILRQDIKMKENNHSNDNKKIITSNVVIGKEDFPHQSPTPPMSYSTLLPSKPKKVFVWILD